MLVDVNLELVKDLEHTSLSVTSGPEVLVGLVEGVYLIGEELAAVGVEVKTLLLVVVESIPLVVEKFLEKIIKNQQSVE